jgi:hypothetical protein
VRLQWQFGRERQSDPVSVVETSKVLPDRVVVVRSEGSNKCLKFRLCIRINFRLVVLYSVQVADEISTTNVCSSTGVTGLKAASPGCPPGMLAPSHAAQKFIEPVQGVRMYDSRCVVVQISHDLPP